MPKWKVRKWKSRKYNLGIALGGGGTRGFAHLGAIQALKEKGIVPDIYSGVSAGAIAGVFLANGIEPEEIRDILMNKKIFDFVKIHIPKKGLLALSGLKDDLEDSSLPENLEELTTPLIVGVSNLNSGNMEYFERGPINKLVIASASIPVLFEPVEYNGSTYCDGGLFENVPVTPLVPLCKKIIAINISPIESATKLNNLIQISSRVFHLSVQSSTDEAGKQCDILIEPKDLSNYDILDVSQAEEVYNIGYEHTMAMKIRL